MTELQKIAGQLPQEYEDAIYDLEHEGAQVIDETALPTLNERVNGWSGLLGIALATIHKSGEWKKWTYQDEQGTEKPFQEFAEYCSVRAPARAFSTCWELMENWWFFQELGYSAREYGYLAARRGPTKLRRMRRQALSQQQVEEATRITMGEALSVGELKVYLDIQVGRPVLYSRKPEFQEAKSAEAEARKVKVVEWRSLKFRLPMDQLSVLEGALEQAMKISGTQDRGQALVLVATGYLAKP